MGTFGINIQTKVVLDDAVKSGSMTPKINIDPKDPQKIISCDEYFILNSLQNIEFKREAEIIDEYTEKLISEGSL